MSNTPSAATTRGQTLFARGACVVVILMGATVITIFLGLPTTKQLGSIFDDDDHHVHNATAPSIHNGVLLDIQRVLARHDLDATKQMDMISEIIHKPLRGHVARYVDSRVIDEHRVVATPATSHPTPELNSATTVSKSPRQDTVRGETTLPSRMTASRRTEPITIVTQRPPLCTASQMQSRLVPMSKSKLHSQSLLADRRYNTGCASIGRNYKCRASAEYAAFLANPLRRQIPEAALNGTCSMMVNNGRYPFPAGSRVLFWGNSHLREVLHSIACQYPDADMTTRGTDQDNACSVSEYKVQEGRGEILWETIFGNNVTIYGVCNCGLMYDRSSALDDIASVIGVDYKLLTHVVANPANVAKWAVDWKYKPCSDHAWYKRLAALSTKEKFLWTPFTQPEELGSALETRGFKGKLIWTLPFWCKSNQRLNRYRWPPAPNLLATNRYVDAVVDFSSYICPDPDFRCEVSGCSKGSSGGHQCLPGPPDDIASAIIHLLMTL